MDTYPVLIGKAKTDWFKILLFITVVVLAFLLFKSCGKPVPKPIVITGEQVHDTIRIVDKEAQRLRDSFMVVLLKKYKDDDNNYQAYLRLLNENAVLLNQNEILASYVPDSCKELQANWVAKFNQVKIANDKKDIAANRTINGLQSTVSTQKKFLSQKDIDYAKMKSIADTCAKSLTELEKYANKLKPKRTIYISAIAIGNENKYLNGYGIGLGLTNRKGTSFEVGAINIGNTINYSISIKKPLFKF